jgi:prepilin-type N-terminal cleavage/methylation domain-containing protein
MKRSRPTIPTVIAAQRGITLLETMIVLAIIGLGMSIGYSAYRKLTRADLVDDTNHLGALMARASELAGESGKLHRVTIDFDENTAVVEICEGLPSIRRPRTGDKVVDDKETQRQLDDARGRLKGSRTDPSASKMMQMQTPEDETKMAAALAGHHVGDQTCAQVKDVWSGDAEGRPLILKIRKDRGIKAREVWVQHRDDSVTTGQVSIYFFPLGSAEKAIVELTDGTETYSVRVHGLTGEIETVDGEVKDVDDFMHKDITGEREAPR